MLGAGAARRPGTSWSSSEDAEAMVDFTAPEAVVANVLRALERGRPVRRRHDGLGAAAASTRSARSAGVAGLLRAELRDRRRADDALRRRGGPPPAARRDRRAAQRGEEGRPPARRGDGERSAAPRSTRCGCRLVAHQEVLFGGDGQLLTIRHDASREATSRRAARAREAPTASGLTVGLDALLG